MYRVCPCFDAPGQLPIVAPSLHNAYYACKRSVNLSLLCGTRRQSEKTPIGHTTWPAVRRLSPPSWRLTSSVVLRRARRDEPTEAPVRTWPCYGTCRAVPRERTQARDAIASIVSRVRLHRGNRPKCSGPVDGIRNAGWAIPSLADLCRRWSSSGAKRMWTTW